MNELLRRFCSLVNRSNKAFTIHLNYPTSSNNSPRWGYDKPPNKAVLAALNKHRTLYTRILKELLEHSDSFARLNESLAPYQGKPILCNPWLPGLDAFCLYGMIARHKPRIYLEIGSGISTKIARSAVSDHDLSTTIISVDPEPRAEIDALCDKCLRTGLEDLDISVFADLSENDILFLDSSHRSFMNSDVTIFFLEVLPILRQGVIVEIHDIFLPFDYPPSWAKRYYNEQYLLAAYVLGGEDRFQILLPNAFISDDQELHSLVEPVFHAQGLEGVSSGGGSFWLSVKQQQCPLSA